MENDNINLPGFTRKPKNSSNVENNYAVLSIVLGAVSYLFICLFPIQLILGGLSIMFALLSKQGEKFEKTAIFGIVLGITSCVISFSVFWMCTVFLEYIKQNPKEALILKELLGFQ